MISLICFSCKKASNVETEQTESNQTESNQTESNQTESNQTELNQTITSNDSYTFDYSWATDNNMIAHALGGIGEYAYTNSLEAFQNSYTQGYRLFEVDFDLSTDGMLICSHDEEYWRSITDSTGEYTYEQFHSEPIYGSLTPLDATQIIDLMVEYPDIYVITDTKYTDKDHVDLQFNQLVQYAMDTSPEVLDRIIPQIYNEDMLDWVMDIYPFSSIIYTLYQTEWTAKSVSAFCQESGVGFVTIPKDSLTRSVAKRWKKNGILIGTHTVNDEDEFLELCKLGVDAFYTDYLLPSN